MFIYGLDKCGKTLITSLWKKKSNAIILMKEIKKFCKKSNRS